MKEETISVRKGDLLKMAEKLLASFSPSDSGATVLTLQGDLGAGKTTFVQAIGRALKVAGHITSPTFSIMNRYDTSNEKWDQLVHMDAYRIDDLNELRPLRFEELLKSPRTLFCIEWPRRIQGALPSHYTELQFESSLNEEVRNVHILQH